MCEASFTNSSDGTLIYDLQVFGVQELQVDVLFDLHVIGIDALCYHGCSPWAVFCSAEAKNK